VPGHDDVAGHGHFSTTNEDHQHAPISNIRHRQIGLPADRRAMAYRIQITRFGVASGRDLSCQAADQNGGDVRLGRVRADRTL